MSSDRFDRSLFLFCWSNPLKNDIEVAILSTDRCLIAQLTLEKELLQR